MATKVWILGLIIVLSAATCADSVDVAIAQDAPTDCTAFTTYEDANAFYTGNPDAAAVLDDDGDGVACEVYFGLERREGLAGAIAAPSQQKPLAEAVRFAQEAEGDLDCEEFETQEEAQAVFEEDPADPHNLDPNGDGIACALLPAADDQDSASGREAEAAQEADNANQTQEERRAARRAERESQQPQNGDGQATDAETETLTCADFETAEEAQAAFDEDPEGLATLDGDGNGIACEELIEPEVAPADDTETDRERGRNRRNQEEEPAPEEVVVDEPELVRIQEDFDCVDFEFQEEAQEVYDQDPSDPYNLDPSGDGFACSSLPSSNPRVTQVPRTGIGAAATVDADLFAAAMLLFTLGAIGASWHRAQR